MDKATNVIAGGAVTAPLWLHDLNIWLSVAVGLLGAVWLTIQIVHKLRHWNR